MDGRIAVASIALNAGTRLRDQIENEILTGALGPGHRLDEVSLATRFGVSRTPIREALMQLAATGLIEMRPRRGAIVAEVGPERLVQMFEVMAELESFAGRAATRRHTEDDKARLLEALEACRKAAETGPMPTTTKMSSFIGPSMRRATTRSSWSNAGFCIDASSPIGGCSFGFATECRPPFVSTRRSFAPSSISTAIEPAYCCASMSSFRGNDSPISLLRLPKQDPKSAGERLCNND